MMLFFVFSLCLSIGNGILPDMPTIVDSDVNRTVEANVSQGHATLNDMFKEVEELMEDTQHKLEDAVHQIDNESAKSNSYAQNDHPENASMSVPGNQSIHLIKQAEQLADNTTEETHFTRSVQTSKENDINHECIIDEDCEKGMYCLYESHHSQCLPCKEVDRSCSKDEECCSGNLCIWGQCSQNATKGERGSICQHQSDCNPDLCCAFHKALLFPVCNSKPIERERCFSSTNHLMELLSWDMEGRVQGSTVLVRGTSNANIWGGAPCAYSPRTPARRS